MKRGAVFNTRRRRLLRPSIPAAESAVGLVVVGVLLGVVAWSLGQRDAFDPGTRDLAPELLTADRPAIPIYHRPLKPWAEPGSAPALTARADLSPFPEAIADDAWRPTGRVRAFGPDNLYEKINGEAEKFLKQGFVSMHYVVLRDAASGAELSVELYDQGDVGGSAGIFSEHAGAGREIAEHAGVTYFLTAAGAVGRTGRWFFRAAADRSSPEVTARAETLVDALAALDAGEPGTAAADETPAGLAALLRAGIDESAVEYQAGNVFQFDFVSDFWFGRLDADGARVFVHRAASADAARALVAAIVDEQGYDYDDLRTVEDTSVMRHGFLDTWFAITHEGPYVYGGENLPDEEAVRPALARVAGALAR